MSELPRSLAIDQQAMPTLVEGIHAALRAAIAGGELAPGFRLREVPLAQRFGCSTTPVREAIRKLESEGLVKIYPRRGAEVTALSFAEVEHLYELRLVLELHAVRAAAERRPTAAELAPVREMLARQADGVGAQSEQHLDAEFHEALLRLGGNPVIAETVATATRQIEAVQSRTAAEVPEGDRAAFDAHAQILDAVAEGETDLAVERMREHLQWARAAVMGALTRSHN